MKTTIEISDSLLERAKRLATREKLTLRELVETGLRRVLDERRTPQQFELADARVTGTGVTPEFQSGGWEHIRDAIYQGRGG